MMCFGLTLLKTWNTRASAAPSDGMSESDWHKDFRERTKAITDSGAPQPRGEPVQTNATQPTGSPNLSAVPLDSRKALERARELIAAELPRYGKEVLAEIDAVLTTLPSDSRKADATCSLCGAPSVNGTFECCRPDIPSEARVARPRKAEPVAARLNQIADNIGGLHAPELRQLAAALTPATEGGGRETPEQRLDLDMALFNNARAELVQTIAAEAERYAGHYPQSSDGRNTFIMFADFVRALSPSSPSVGTPEMTSAQSKDAAQ